MSAGAVYLNKGIVPLTMLSWIDPYNIIGVYFSINVSIKAHQVEGDVKGNRQRRSWRITASESG